MDDYVHTFDDDGNQTIIKTATGIWQVQYNGENRPIQWSNGATNIVMSFDRMGRRVTKNAQWFVYDGYLQIADKNRNKYIWNPTETMASSPLVWGDSFSAVYYASDGNKNISEVVSDNGNVVAHYEYAPFATVSVHHGALSATNPWRFSSEFADDETAMIYYNYRHYAPMMGRWLSRDPIGERDASSLLLFVGNAPLSYCDRIGLAEIMCTNQKPGVVLKDRGLKKEDYPIPGGKDAKGNSIYAAGKVEPGELSIDICCQCVAKSSGREYSLVVQVKSSYRIRIVKVGSEGNEHTKKAGYGNRTQAGYDRTLKHEKVHVKQMSNTMHKIYKDLTTGIPEKFPRNECNAKSDLAKSRMLNAKGDWDIMIMNGNAHTGEEWKEWKKTDGKTETDPELW